MDEVNQQVALEVLSLLGRARGLFAGDGATGDPPTFAPDPTMEDGLGRGTFSAGE